MRLETSLEQSSPTELTSDLSSGRGLKLNDRSDSDEFMYYYINV